MVNYNGTSMHTENTKLINPFHAIGLFDTPWKHQKTKGFPIFSGGIQRDQWDEIG